MPKACKGEYRAFTTEFDREVRFANAPTASAFALHNPAFADCDLDTSLENWAPRYEPAAHAFVANLLNTPLRNIAISFLLDHSGSLRGEKCCLMAATVGIASECLTRLNVRHEILGFTTRSWHGGESRRKWISAGQPNAPGRLCDLLHIVYRTFQGEEPLAYEALQLMADPRILKENVDGEAVLWAIERLEREAAARHVLVVISDGAPVDDSTLLFNGPNILDDHLRLVTSKITGDHRIELYGVGLHYKMFRYYPQYCVVESPDDIGATFLPVLNALLATNAHAPSPAQGAAILTD